MAGYIPHWYKGKLTLLAIKTLVKDNKRMWTVILFSIPIFYIYGIVSFILFLVRSTTSKEKPVISEPENKKEQFTAQFILELEDINSKTPNKKIADVISEYKLKLKQVAISTYYKPNPSVTQAEPIINSDTNTPPVSLTQDIIQAPSHWYSENAISLLLYTGAFFIVASASIFVGFQWETLGGITKALILTVLTLIFFASGIYSYGIPKIKTAGRVFIAIGALLIPFCGLAWYNFVLKDFQVSFGLVWFFTSLIALVAYVTLAFYLKNTFYPYITSITTLSLLLSMVKVNEMDTDFYILFGIITAIILFLTSIILRATTAIVQETFKLPLEISAHIIMPLMLLFGIITAIDQDKLFTLQATFSVLLATLFYLSDYLFTKRIWSLATTQLLLSGTVILFFNWIQADSLTLLYLLSILASVDIYIAFISNRYHHIQETDLSLVMGLLKLITIFAFSFSITNNALHYTVFALLPGIASIVIALIKREFKYNGITAVFVAISIYLYLNNVLLLEGQEYIIAYVYTLIGLACYLASLKYRALSETCSTLCWTSAGYFVIAVLIGAGFPGAHTVIGIVAFIVVTSAAYFYKNNQFLYAANSIFLLSIIQFLRYMGTDNSYYPLIFTAISYLFFVVAQAIPLEYKKYYRHTAIITSIGTPIIFGIMSIDQADNNYSYYSNPDPINSQGEINSLIAAYSSVALITLDSLINSSAKMKYVASAIAMTTYLWQLKILHVSETQVYTLPLGIYFAVLAYIQRIKNNEENWTILNYIALAIFILPGLFQSFEADGAVYALLLGVIGIIILSFGVSINYKTYIYAGIAALVLAVLSQTYEYFLSLERWMVTGIVGVVFLATAVYLLLHRKDNSTH